MFVYVRVGVWVYATAFALLNRLRKCKLGTVWDTFNRVILKYFKNNFFFQKLNLLF